jgi:V/A-type H+/Na+-transporting ATPase subunit K
MIDVMQNLILVAKNVPVNLPPVVIEGFNWSQFLAYLGLGMLGLGLAGSAIGLSIAGSAVAGMKEEKRNQGLAVSVLPGTQGLYSFAVGFLLLGKLAGASNSMYLQIFACGTITGLACLFSGWWQGVVCAAGAKSINQDKMPLGTALLLAVLPEFYAILSFAFSIILMGKNFG